MAQMCGAASMSQSHCCGKTQVRPGTTIVSSEPFDVIRNLIAGSTLNCQEILHTIKGDYAFPIGHSFLRFPRLGLKRKVFRFCNSNSNGPCPGNAPSRFFERLC